MVMDLCEGVPVDELAMRTHLAVLDRLDATTREIAVVRAALLGQSQQLATSSTAQAMRTQLAGEDDTLRSPAVGAGGTGDAHQPPDQDRREAP